MKKCLFYIILLISLASCKATKVVSESQPVVPATENVTPATNFSLPETWLLGYFNQSQLAQPPYSEFYLKGFGEYSYNEGVMTELKKIPADNLNIKIVMGTWCPDSRREVPRFMRIIDGWDFPANKIQFIGVDNGKRSPVGEYEGLGIERVPTFIIYKNNIEIGRIIENPITSLEQDMLNILNKKE